MKRNKYNVDTSKKGKEKRTVDGVVFMSQKEAKRYIVLKRLEKKGEIKDLELQPKFILQLAFTDYEDKKHREISYFADFRYYDNKIKDIVVEDTKGWKTEVYKIKKKMLLYSYQDLIFIET